jgi:hypothetical protein
MTVDRIHVLVEEPSMESMLLSLLPKLVGNLAFEIFRYNGKPDLLDKLPARLRGYKRWLPPSWRIVVVVDRDDDECDVLKAKLEGISREAGLVTRTASQGERWAVVNRLAIEELEAWYFGDWEAVRKAYPKVPAGVPRQASYRDPDAIAGGSWEAFERVLQRVGYFPGGLRKIEAAATIGPHMVPARNRSRSFQRLQAVFLEVLGEA